MSSTPTIYEWMGGAEAMNRLTEAFYGHALQDEILAPVFAGMPSIRLTDVARLRLEAISFFLLVFVLAVVGVWGLWKVVRRDFPSLPRLSFVGALGVVTLWGLLFVLVLTMISGARELMTPRAWEQRGYTYQIAEPPSPAATEPTTVSNEDASP